MNREHDMKIYKITTERTDSMVHLTTYQVVASSTDNAVKILEEAEFLSGASDAILEINQTPKLGELREKEHIVATHEYATITQSKEST